MADSDAAAPKQRRLGDRGFLLDTEVDVAALPVPDGPAPGAVEVPDEPVIDMGFLSLPAEVQLEVEEHAAGTQPGAAERLAEQLGQLHQDHPTTEMGEAAQVMVAMLDVALHGATWARPQSPEQVWRVLLDEVARLRDAEQRAEQLQRDLAATARLLGEAQERAERAEVTIREMVESGGEAVGR